MLPIDDEKKYEEVIKLLKDLPKVSAPSNFESLLTRRINSNEPLKIKESWFDKIFSPKLIPSAALAVTTVIVLLLLKGNLNEAEDPFQIIPKLREDFRSESKAPSIDRQKDWAVNESNTPTEDSNLSQISSQESASLEKISVNTINYTPDEAVVLSGGLNFKALRMGEEEQKQINMLREKLNRSVNSVQNN